MDSNFDSVVTRFKELINEHGSRSPEVRDYLDEHPDLQRLIDSISTPQEGLEIVSSV